MAWGQSKEFHYIKDLVPPFKRYIEPFFGGGAVFFKLQPKSSVINDVDKDLVDLYRFAKGELDRDEFKKELDRYAENWEKISSYISIFENKFTKLYSEFGTGKINQQALKTQVEKYIGDEEKRFNGLFSAEFCINDSNLSRQIISNLNSKVVRTAKIEKIAGQLSQADLHKNIETAFRSGFYMHFRDLMNWDGKTVRLSHAKRVANFYFVREFCYGAMFRYNAKGEFNIPYGGIAYNSKDFCSKVNTVLSPKVQKVLAGADIHNEDFEKVIRERNLTEDDFMFLDPPYDTEFSDYSNNVFNQGDQERLARCLYGTKAKYILIIKNTPLIYSLYNKPGIKIESFEKQYLYNVKGRNNRDVEHLIVRNFQPQLLWQPGELLQRL
jgi:DNA adenine methylase